MTTDEIRKLYAEFVVPTYAPQIALVRGDGCRVFDAEGRAYLDFAGGIAVCSLGHRHPALVDALREQAGTLIHVSNLYYNEWQPQLAAGLVRHLGPGKCFFSNSGAEANEALIKLARKWGGGRHEVISMLNSFHGRTLGAMAATGQDKIRNGFEPMPAGFKQVAFDDLEAVKRTTGEKTAAVLIECIQGEGGVRPASHEFVSGLRDWCDRNNLLLFCDCVQCGVGRTGKFCSFQHYGIEMDGVSLAKGLGGGFPIGAVWIRKPYADVLGVGSHATTFGGSPLGARAACAVLDTLESENLIDQSARIGKYLAGKLEELRRDFPGKIREVRGKGLMVGIELAEESKPWVERLAEAGLLVVPTASNIIRLLPPLIVREPEADEAVRILRKTFSK